MWELNYKESWALKNWCFWTEVLEKTLESSLECKEIKPVNPKGNQSWIFIGRTDAEAETPLLWPLDGKNWQIRKDPGAGEDWRQEDKGTTEDETVGWHHWLDEHAFEQAPGVGDGQGSLACCSPWGHNWHEHNWASELTELNQLPSLRFQNFGLMYKAHHITASSGMGVTISDVHLNWDHTSALYSSVSVPLNEILFFLFFLTHFF